MGAVNGRWPFAGRGAELARLRARLCASGTRGVVLAGEAGVGKSRLAAELLRSAGAGRQVVRAMTTPGARELPFGAFAHLLPPGQAPAAQLNPLRWAAQEIVAPAAGRPLLLSIDDAHLLDPASAALTHHLALTGQAFVVATVRSGEPAPEPVRALWKDELLERVELGPLSEQAVAEVVDGALDGPVAHGTIRRLHELSQGNALLLKELVMSGLSAGRLATVAGEWRWSDRYEEPGGPALAPRLAKLIIARLGDLEPALEELLELVAFGEPIGADVLVRACSAAALEAAEDRRLVRLDEEGRRLYVRCEHPLYAELIRARCPRSRMLRRQRELAGAVEATGARRRDDVLRVAVWRLNTGTVRDPAPLLEAARLAWAAPDLELAARLAGAAHEAGGGTRAALLRANTLLNLHRLEEADRVLDAARHHAADESERVRIAAARYRVLVSQNRGDEADRTLAGVERSVEGPAAQRELLTARAAMTAMRGDPGTARPAARRLLADPGATPGQAAQVRCSLALLDAYSGRVGRALEEADRLARDEERWRSSAPYLRPLLVAVRSAAYLLGGQPQRALDMLADEQRAGTAERWPPALVMARAEQARATRMAGRVASARRIGDLTGLEPSHWDVCLHAEVAHAAALAGDAATAREALAMADAPVAAFFELFRPWAERARIWLAVAEGDIERARSLARAAAEQARASDLCGYEVLALHDIVRLGGAASVAGRLERLAEDLEGALAPLAARHARAAADEGGSALSAVSEEFARLGLRLHSAEAAAQAATAFAREGDEAGARAMQARAWALAKQCEGARTPALDRLRAPGLTRREWQVAELAASGLTSRQIADRLVVSVRTVDNHLASSYAKLGVTGRSGLAGALGI